MKNVDIISRVVARKGETISSSSKGAKKNDFSDYLLKSIWEKVFEIRTDNKGSEYIFGKLPVVTQYGITMYSGDGVDIPSLASGLPFDGRTIWYNPNTNQIEVIGGTGGGSGEGVSNFWDLSGIPSWITISKPKYSYSEIEGTPDLSDYVTQNWIINQGYASAEELKKYIPISGYTEVSGEKNFTGGLKVNGSPIYYDTEKKYWKLEGDLLVTGGVTMYGVDSTDIPSLINSLPVASTKEKGVAYFDPDFFSVSSDGKVSFIGETGGGLDIVSLQNYLTQNSYLNVTEGDNRYLKLTGGTIKGRLTVENNDIFPLRVKNTYSDATNAFLMFYANSASLASIGSSTDGFLYRYNKELTETYKIWDSGNDGANSGLDADLLDGKHNGELTAQYFSQGKLLTNADTINTLMSGVYCYINGNNPTGAIDNNVTLLSFRSYGRDDMFQIASSSNNKKLYYRGASNIGNSYEAWGEWKEVAFTTSNVASATKLQKARTIWGKSFDGTGDVSGNLEMGISKVYWNDDASNYFITVNGAGQMYHTSYYGIFFRTGGSDRLAIDSSGNVGIGTASPAYKLDVDGTFRCNSIVTGGDSYVALLNVNRISATTAYIHLFVTGGTNNARPLVLQNGYGNVGIGVAAPTHKLHVVGNTYLNGDVFADELNTYDVIPRASATYDLGNSSYKWNNVYASSMIAGYIHGGGSALYLGNSDNSSYIYIREDMKASSENWSLTTSGTMSLSGDLTSGSYGSNCVAKFQGIGSGNGYSSVVELITNNEVSISYSNNSRYSDSRRWSVGRASSNSNYRFNFWNASYNGAVSYIDLNGNFWVAGGITMYSDRRKKTILRDVELSLKEVVNAPLVEHYYNSDDKKTIHVGSIAQYWAGLNDWFCKLDSEGYYTMEIQNAALASAISVARELERYESKTDKDIKKLKKRICELEEEVERLKSA